MPRDEPVTIADLSFDAMLISCCAGHPLRQPENTHLSDDRRTPFLRTGGKAICAEHNSSLTEVRSTPRAAAYRAFTRHSVGVQANRRLKAVAKLFARG